MINIRALDFLMNKVHKLSVLNCSSDFEYTVDLFQNILDGNFCESDIDLGIIFVKKIANGSYLLIDGKRRYMSILLLLIAIFKYHKTLSPDVSVLANQIQLRFLNFGGHSKFLLFGLEKTVYEKIINDEPLSYNEKQTEIYKTLDIFMENIRNLDFDVEEFYELVKRLKFSIVFVENIMERDIFYSINKPLRPLNQLMLFKSYLAESYHSELVDNLYFIFSYKEEMFVSFFQSYLAPKFNRIISDTNLIYEYFVRYIETVKKYQNFDEIISSIIKTAKVYKKMYNAEFIDPEIRNMFIKIISNDGKDTFSYLLELCEDFENNYLSKEVLLDIGQIMNTYIQERKVNNTYKDFDFSQMAQELNKVIYDENSEK